MPICAPGTSVPKSGYQPVVAMSAAGIEAALIEAGVSGGTAVVMSAALAGLTVVLSNFCGTDPPADPGLTAADVAAAIAFIPTPLSIPAQDKLAQWFLRWYWYQVCQCSGSVVPAQPALVSPVNITPNAGVPGAPNGSCFDNQTTTTHGPQTGFSGSDTDLTSTLVPVTGTPITSTHLTFGLSGGITGLVWPIPPTLQSITFTAQSLANDPAVANDSHYEIDTNFTDSSGFWLSGTEIIQTNTTGIQTRTIVRGDGTWSNSATYFCIGAHKGGDAASTLSETIQVEAVGTCIGSALQTNCCPPDPTITNQLAKLIGIVNAIYAGLPSNPNSFAESTVHSGLSGSGNIVLGAGVIAVKVSITTVPTDVGIGLGDPLIYFDAGFITTSAVEGNYQSQRLEHSPQVFILPLLTDTVHYTLPAGEVVTIIELVRGP